MIRRWVHTYLFSKYRAVVYDGHHVPGEVAEVGPVLEVFFTEFLNALPILLAEFSHLNHAENKR